MPKRFTETNIWSEDWFLEMPREYKLFWFYVKDQCNHAGIWRPNSRLFEAMIEGKADLNVALNFFNTGKCRVQILESGHWFLNDFFVFQYGETFNPNNRLHKSIQSIYNQENIILTSIRGLKVLKYEGNDTLKEKDKDKEKEKDKKEEEVQEGKPEKILEGEDELNYSFDYFWNLYDKKVGDKSKIEKKWKKLSDAERGLIVLHITKYKEAQPDKQFRKDPETYLNNKSWNDEIIPRTLLFPKTNSFKKVAHDTDY